MSNTKLRFKLAHLLYGIVLVCVLAGWYASLLENQRVRADFESQLKRNSEAITAASLKVASQFDFRNIAGKPITNYPLIMALSHKNEYEPENLLRNVESNLFYEFLGNAPEYWNAIRGEKKVLCYNVVLEDGPQLEGHAQVSACVAVVDGKIALVIWTHHELAL